MKSLPPPATRSRFTIAVSTLLLFIAVEASAQAVKTTETDSLSGFHFVPPARTLLPDFERFHLQRLAPSDLLTDKGKVSTYLKVNGNFSELVYTLLPARVKVSLARRAHADAVRIERIKNLNETIDLVGLTDPQRAKTYRRHLHVALTAAR